MIISKQILRQTVAIFPVFIISLLAGMGFVWPASSFRALQSSEAGVQFSLADCTMAASCIYFGRMASPVIGVLILGRCGRKTPLVVAALSMLIGSLLLIPEKTQTYVFISRFIFGFATGTYTPFCNMYVGEISSKNVRGIFATLYVMFYDIGTLLQFFCGWHLTYKQTAILTTAISAAALLSTYYLTESPFFLISKGQKQRAYNILCYLRDSRGKVVSSELQDTRGINSTANVCEFVSNFKRPEVYKSFIIVIILGIIASLLMTVTVSFANYLIPSTKYLSGDAFAMILCCIPVWASLSSTFLIERYGRRTLLMSSFISIGVMVAIVSVLLYIDERTSYKVPYFTWILAVVILLFVTIFSFSTYPTVIAIRSEMFPPAYKVFGTNTTIMFNSLTSLLSTVIFIKLKELNLIYVVFVAFTITCKVALAFTYFVVPETKGKTLNEIQRMLRGDPPTQDS
ncbi:solute carrier family 2, facilitated glucose transporter member 8-like [Planococcus citri]|uniref:solute carrier family 2, facilitated glucose transporter member 8-like n=1 Tax=Planococcus citri TaxID=170843 RepID=UPI0031F7D058